MLPQEALDEAARVKLSTKRKPSGNPLQLAAQYDRILRETPALTRKDFAGRLGITPARLNQILALLKGERGR